MKKVILALSIGMLFIPGMVSATTTPQLSPEQVASIVAQIAALQAQLQAQLAAEPSADTDTPALEELKFNRILKRGTVGDDVRKLQQALALRPDIYPEGLVTGYFGSLTEKAVKALQKSQGVVSSGSPETTGFGQVGPKTAAKLNEIVVRGGGGGAWSNASVSTAQSNSSTQSTGVTPTQQTNTTSSTVTSTGTTTSNSSASTTTTVPPVTPVTGDHTGPRITSLSISPTSVAPGGQVTFTVIADDVSGVGNVIYDISYPGSSYVLRPNCNFLLAPSGTCTFTESVDHGISPTLLGSYVIGTVRVNDGAGNVATYYPNGTVTNGPSATHSLVIPAIVVSNTSSSGGGGSSGGSGGSTTTADTTAPSVSISAPTGGSTVSGTVSLSATATDNVGVAGVQFLLDGANVGSEDAVAPFSISWNTTSVSNGTHTLSARARDAAGNQTTSSSISVTVSNGAGDITAPTVSITSPTNGATIEGNLNFNLDTTATDNIGVVGVKFLIDGLYITSVGSAPYGTILHASDYSSGVHSLAAVAIDAAGNTATSTISVTFTAIPAGTITASISSNNIPATSLVVSNSSPKVTSLRFTTTNDTFTITELTTSVATAGDATAITSLTFKNGATILATQSLVGAVATTPLSLSIPSGTSKDIDVYANIATIGSGAGNSGANVGVTLTGFKAQNSSGTTTAYSTNLVGPNRYAYKTNPTISRVSLPTSVLSAGIKTIRKINITADASGPIAWRKLVLNYTASGNVSLGSFQIVDANTGTPLTDITAASTGNTIAFTSSSDQEIAGSKTYEIKATVTGSLQAGDYVTTSLSAGTSQYSVPTTFAGVSSAANFVWSDESASSHSDTSADWNNDYLVKNLPLEEQTLSF